jgi:predicted nuclease of predicted toxin-antitoxin system
MRILVDMNLSPTWAVFLNAAVLKQFIGQSMGPPERLIVS